MKAYILGCGPAGMMAAHAVNLAREKAIIEIGSDQLEKSKISGAQYLSGPVIGATGQAHSRVRFYKLGTREGYAQKVYGNPEAPCSWDRYEHEEAYPMYDLNGAYDRVWEMYKAKLFQLHINPDIMASFLDTDADLIITSIPKLALCSSNQHQFVEQVITVVDGLPHEVDGASMKDPNWILYDGNPESPWYRVSKLYGKFSTEFSGDRRDTLGRGRKITKPMWTNCTCWDDPRVLSVGRYGRWDKDVLIHDAYTEVLRALL